MRKLFFLPALLCGGCAGSSPAEFSPEVFIGTPTTLIGSEDDSGILFGTITDLEVLPDGSLLIADGVGAMVHHVSESGELIATFGRSGEGPGEFSRPADIALLPGDEYLVLDSERFELTRVRIDGSSHTFVSTVPMSTQALRFCTSGDEVVVNAFHGEYGLLRLDLSGLVLQRTFELAPEIDASLQPALQDELTDQVRLGFIDCLEGGGVLFGSEWLATLRLFDRGGREAQRAELDGFVPLEYELDSDGSVGVVLPGSQWVHRVVAVHEVAPGYAMLQLMRYGPGGGGRDDPPTELRIVRFVDGAQVAFPDTLPVISWIGEGEAWGWRNLPFPQVVRFPVSVAIH